MFAKLVQARQDMKKNGKKGFTLVELLIVITIMLILAAIMIPSFARYITRANNASVVAEARAAHVAASVIYQDAYVAGTHKASTNDTLTNSKLNEWAEVSGDMTKITVKEDGTVTAFTYTDGSNPAKVVTWEQGGAYVVSNS